MADPPCLPFFHGSDRLLERVRRPMSDNNVFTLEALEAEIERQYAPLKFQAAGEEFVLRSLLRIGKKDRDAVMEKLKDLETEDEELNEDVAFAAVQFVLKTVVADNKGAKLSKVLGDDLLRNMKVLEKWVEATQPGEATDSPS